MAATTDLFRENVMSSIVQILPAPLWARRRPVRYAVRVDSPSSQHETVVICPTEFERRQLERAGVTRFAAVRCCGVGAEALVRWVEARPREGGEVILAGLAGSLRETCPVGRAFPVGTVIAPSGRQYRALTDMESRRDVRSDASRVVVASSPTVLVTAQEKRAWAARTGADMVDLESAIFAEAATMLGWRWAIIRGVSDGHDDALPPDVGRWVDAQGRTRPARVVLAIVHRPWLIPRLLRLRRESRRAMAAVAKLLLDRLSPDRRVATPTLEAPAVSAP